MSGAPAATEVSTDRRSGTGGIVADRAGEGKPRRSQAAGWNRLDGFGAGVDVETRPTAHIAWRSAEGAPGWRRYGVAVCSVPAAESTPSSENVMMLMYHVATEGGVQKMS